MAEISFQLPGSGAILAADESRPPREHWELDETFPGWGLPVNHTPEIGAADEDKKSRCRFKNAIQDWNGSQLCIREITMMSILRELMEKPEWDRKVFDEDITTKWREEALRNFDISKKMWKYGLAELQYKAKTFKETSVVLAIDFDCKVVYSDSTLSLDEAQALSAAVASLENVPEHRKDWHPGSDGQVLDLVHPSLYPLVYGLSRVLPKGKVSLTDCALSIGSGEIIPVPEKEETLNQEWFNENASKDPDIWSGRFQWLPCDVSFSGENVSITSYINNLHPLHNMALYKLIENVISKSIPLWNEVLESTENQMAPRLDVGDYSDYWPRGEERPKGRRVRINGGSDEGSDEITDDDDIEYAADLDHEWRQRERRTKHPEPDGPYEPPPAATAHKMVDLRQQFGQTGLQVIVKLANIHLTSEKPNYPGGSWHIEGQLNEHIVATSLFYYDQENISDSTLAFRQAMDVEEEIDYQQNEFQGIEDVLGIKNEEPAFSELGSVHTKEGRLLAFPNVLQHRVQPFSTRDSSKPGYRKILALFLVDPHIRILSTSKVPPQQKELWDSVVKGAQDIKGLRDMPLEIVSHILEDCDDFPITLSRAKEIREELMDERRRIDYRVKTSLEANSFSFCEH